MNIRYFTLAATLITAVACLQAKTIPTHVLFSPYDHPTTTLIGLINQAKTSISAAVYMFTDKNIAQALADAKKRGVDVAVIIDQISTGKYGKVDILNAAGIPVYVFDPKTPINPKSKSPKAEEKKETDRNEDKWFSNVAIMHNKFMILDETVLWTGSFNWTNAANVRNCENAIFMQNPDLCRAYQFYFDTLRMERCTVYNGPTSDDDNAERSKKRIPLKDDVAAALKSYKDDDGLIKQLVTILQNNGIHLFT